MFKGATKFRATLATVVAAMALAACGGGGGGGDAASAVGGTVGAPVGGGGGGGGPVALTFAQTAAPAQTYHTMATSADGQVAIAAGLPGTVYVTTDGGTTWTAAPGLPSGDPGGRWIAVDVSANGANMVAVAYGGALYRSTDSGASWTQIDTAFNTGNLPYEGVTISDNGNNIVVAVGPGSLYVTTTGGLLWTNPTGVPANSPWRSVDSSASGAVVVAANHDGNVFISNDSGASFTALPVDVGGTVVNDGWYRVALSRDGSKVALVGNEQWGLGVPAGSRSSGIYVGTNTGGTWNFVQGSTVAGNYGAVTMSADGSVIVASQYDNGGPGQVLISTNGGTSFSTLAAPAGASNWRAAAINGAATRLYLGEGDFAAGVAGSLYVSSGTLQ